MIDQVRVRKERIADPEREISGVAGMDISAFVDFSIGLIELFRRTDQQICKFQNSYLGGIKLLEFVLVIVEFIKTLSLIIMM